MVLAVEVALAVGVAVVLEVVTAAQVDVAVGVAEEDEVAHPEAATHLQLAAVEEEQLQQLQDSHRPQMIWTVKVSLQMFCPESHLHLHRF